MNRLCAVAHQAADGEQGLAMILASMEKGEPYDLVLMDFIMPVMVRNCAKKILISIYVTFFFHDEDLCTRPYELVLLLLVSSSFFSSSSL